MTFDYLGCISWWLWLISRRTIISVFWAIFFRLWGISLNDFCCITSWGLITRGLKSWFFFLLFRYSLLSWNCDERIIEFLLFLFTEIKWEIHLCVSSCMRFFFFATLWLNWRFTYRESFFFTEFNCIRSIRFLWKWDTIFSPLSNFWWDKTSIFSASSITSINKFTDFFCFLLRLRIEWLTPNINYRFYNWRVTQFSVSWLCKTIVTVFFTSLNSSNNLFKFNTISWLNDKLGVT